MHSRGQRSFRTAGKVAGMLGVDALHAPWHSQLAVCGSNPPRRVESSQSAPQPSMRDQQSGPPITNITKWKPVTSEEPATATAAARRPPHAPAAARALLPLTPTPPRPRLQLLPPLLLLWPSRRPTRSCCCSQLLLRAAAAVYFFLATPTVLPRRPVVLVCWPFTRRPQ